MDRFQEWGKAMVVELHSPDELAPLVHAALRAWYAAAGSDQNLLEGLLLVQERRRSMSGSSNPTALRLATNQVLLEGIEELKGGDERAAKVLKMRFADGNTLKMAAIKLHSSEFAVSRWQRAAIELLSDILYEREMDARQTRVQAIEAHLPPSTYTQLFGVGEAEAKLLERLLEPDGPAVVAIVGIGGIGKTALADAVTRKIAGQLQFDDIAWLRAEPQTMSGRGLSPRLTFETLVAELAEKLALEAVAGPQEQQLARIRQVLKARPYLVVIDNLETDSETAYLLDHLHDLSGPSKFILTTRTRQSAQATVFHFDMSELSLADATSLVLHHARDIGLAGFIQSDEEPVRAIFDATGGNPLALKLVVSLLDLLPLQQILADLASSRPGPVEDLYKHIYWQAWQVLSPEARSLLQAMPLVGDTGGTPEYLQTIGNLPDDRFWPALGELRSRSLVEVRGSIQEKRYGIHRLTESFLRTEIINGPDE